DTNPGNKGFNVSHIQNDEWLQYTVQADTAAAYTVVFRSAANALPAIIHLEIDGVSATSNHTLPITGGWQTWANSSIENVILPAGEHKVKIYFDRGGSNFGFFSFTNPIAVDAVPFLAISSETNNSGSQIELTLNKPITSFNANPTDFHVTTNGNLAVIGGVAIHASNPQKVVISMQNSIGIGQLIKLSYNGNSIETDGNQLATFSNMSVKNNIPNRFFTPVRIQAEDYNFNSGFQLEDCSDTGGGKNLSHANNGDYVDYLIHITEGGEHDFDFRVASSYSNGQLAIQLGNGANINTLKTITFSGTGGWQTWTNQSIKVNLPMGDYTLRLKSVDGEYNLNWFDVVKATAIEDTKLNTTINVYPNPSNGNVNVNATLDSFSNVMIEIIDITGRKMAQKQLISVNEINENFDLSNVKKGVYLVRVKTESGSVVVKHIIE
ncbi:MAG: carbohydrate-binding protein, partial [Ignavibacteria bacterium]|nr:carbohydrate-binding protein [Ignavibacteria bacterium]